MSHGHAREVSARAERVRSSVVGSLYNRLPNQRVRMYSTEWNPVNYLARDYCAAVRNVGCASLIAISLGHSLSQLIASSVDVRSPRGISERGRKLPCPTLDDEYPAGRGLRYPSRP